MTFDQILYVVCLVIVVAGIVAIILISDAKPKTKDH